MLRDDREKAKKAVSDLDAVGLTLSSRPCMFCMLIHSVYSLPTRWGSTFCPLLCSQRTIPAARSFYSPDVSLPQLLSFKISSNPSPHLANLHTPAIHYVLAHCRIRNVDDASLLVPCIHCHKPLGVKIRSIPNSLLRLPSRLSTNIILTTLNV